MTITHFFRQMRNKLDLNLGKDLLMKILRHHRTLKTICVKSNLLISEGIKFIFTGKKSKYLGTGPLTE